LEILKRYGAGKISQLQPSQFPAVIKDCQHLIRKTKG
jgi:hypothetical protein